MNSVEIGLCAYTSEIETFAKVLLFLNPYIQDAYIDYGSTNYSEYTSENYCNLSGRSNLTKDQLQVLLWFFVNHKDTERCKQEFNRIESVKKYQNILEDCWELFQ